MKSTKLSAALLTSAILLLAATAGAAGIDMNDPRRALGREGDVRIDALVRETVSAGVPIAVTYQIQNFSPFPVAIAHRVTDASYDDETRTITLVIGSEVPPDGNMPQVVLIPPGERKVLTAAATPVMSAAVRAARGRLPRLVQMKVAILRDLQPFLPLIEKQDPRIRQRLTDEQFEQWFASNDTIYLNAVPIRYMVTSDDTDVSRAEARAGL